MAKKTIDVKGIAIQLDDAYISLTDIARNNSEIEPHASIRSWLRNQNTISFLGAWEETFNPNFKPVQMDRFRGMAADRRLSISPKRFIEETEAIGLRVKAGRYGGTYAHKDIALDFCGWLSPVFKVAMIKAFRVLIEEAAEQRNFEWHLAKITNNIDEVRNLLDTIPGQLPHFNRVQLSRKEEEE